ncbi:MAG TPA: arginase [Burkholderiales bacterium]|jgi:arginase
MPIELIGAEIGEGASDQGCRAGPRALQRFGLAERVSARWADIVSSDPALRAHGALALAHEFSLRLSASVRQAMLRGSLPLVVGGDHSCAVGTWGAAAEVLRPRGRLGLVWVDAHLDSHTPETSDTKALHGMPLAALMGHGPPELTAIGATLQKIDPRDVVIIGTRSYEAGEAALVERLGVRVMHMDEVRARGFADCLGEAVALASANTAAWGLSFDLDALDPADAPGTGTPVPGGIALREAVAGTAMFARDPRLVAAEIAEYNPFRDPGRKTAAAVVAIAAALRGTDSSLAKPRRAA